MPGVSNNLDKMTCRINSFAPTHHANFIPEKRRTDLVGRQKTSSIGISENHKSVLGGKRSSVF